MRKILFGLVGFGLAVGVPVFGLDTNALPLGDGKYSSSPKVGYILSCQTNFSSGAAGAHIQGPWIHGSTWNLSEKSTVSGSVSWPNAIFSISENAGSRLFTGNALPVETKTGTFPIASTETAYQYDRNPNSIKSQTVSFSVPLNPTVNTDPSCIGMGPVGIATNGVAIYNGFDAGGRDAVANEVQDSCSGHPQQQGQYHYHGPSECLSGAKTPNALVGYAMDGFGIYSMYKSDGAVYQTSELDACHGITSSVMWNGSIQNVYHYVLTRDFPYTLGCFRGTPARASMGSAPQSGYGVGAPTTLGQGTNAGQPVSNMLGQNIINDTLKIGSLGDNVTLLQAWLEQQGHLVIPAGVSRGYFGKLTENALKKYQSASGLDPVGIFGPKTRIRFNSAFQSGTQNQQSPNQQGNFQSGIGPQSQIPGGQTPQSTPGQLSPAGGASRGQGYGQGSAPSQNAGATPPSLPVIAGQGQGGMPPIPPQEAIKACNYLSSGSACSFIGREGVKIAGYCSSIAGLGAEPSIMACKPVGAPVQ